MRRWRAGLPALGWEAAIADPPPLGEGDHAKHGGGAREVFPVLFIRNATPPVPLHHPRWSPSPCRGGSADTGRFHTFLIAGPSRRPHEQRRLVPAPHFSRPCTQTRHTLTLYPPTPP